MTVERSRPTLLAEALILGLFLFVAGWSALLPLQEFDIWLHLRAGEEMLASGTIPRTDPYSFTAPGAEWIYHEWGFAVAVAALFREFGLRPLLILQSVFAGGIFTLLAVTMFRLIGPPPERTLLTIGYLALGLVLLKVRFLIRPHLVSLFLLTLLLYLLYRGGRARWLVPFLFPIWANIHGDVMWGLAVLFLWGMVEVLLRKRDGYPMVGVFFLALGGTLLNPYGWKLFKLAFLIGSYDEYHRHILEWLPPLPDIFLAAILPVLAVVAAAGWTVRRDRRPFEFILAMLGIIALARARRYFPMGFIFTVPLVALAAARWRVALARVPDRRWLLPAATLAIVIIIGRTTVPAGIALDYEPRYFPFAAWNFIRDHRLHGRTLATYAYGTGLLFPLARENPVFIDGRWEVYGEEIFREYWTIVHGLDPGGLDRRQVDLVLIEVRPFVFAGSEIPGLARILADDSAWQLAFFDDVALLFVRRAAFPEFHNGYARAWPLLPPEMVAAAWTDFLPEFERMQADSPFRSWAYLTAGSALKAAGNDTAALTLFVQALREDPTNSVIYAEAGDSLLTLNAFTAATNAFTAAARSDPGNPRIWLYQGQYALARRNYHKAAGYFREALRIVPADLVIRRQLAVALLEQGEMEAAIRVLREGYQLTGNPQLLLLIGGVYQNKLLFDQAVPWIQSYLKQRPDDRAARYALGSCYLNLRRFDDALQVYLELGKMGEDSARYHGDLGGIYLVLDDFDRARRELDRARALEPDNARVRRNRELLDQRTAAVIRLD